MECPDRKEALFAPGVPWCLAPVQVTFREPVEAVKISIIIHDLMRLRRLREDDTFDIREADIHPLPLQRSLLHSCFGQEDAKFLRSGIAKEEEVFDEAALVRLPRMRCLE